MIAVLDTVGITNWLERQTLSLFIFLVDAICHRLHLVRVQGCSLLGIQFLKYIVITGGSIRLRGKNG